jgi:hypothetical protein
VIARSQPAGRPLASGQAELGEHMRPSLPRSAPVALTAMAGSAVEAIALHPRTHMLKPRASTVAALFLGMRQDWQLKRTTQ